MRYAFLSDIHSNLEALTAVLNSLASQRIDRVVCLGDLVGYGADPSACLSHLQTDRFISVCGNHDWGCIGKLTLSWFNEAAQEALRWTRDRLNFAELDFLRRLPLVQTLNELTIAHGTLAHPQRFDYLLNVAQAVDTLKLCRTLICGIGHTHLPMVYEYDLQQRRISRVLSEPEPLREVKIAMEPTRLRYLINPGSVGQPRDGDPRASFALVDTEKAVVQIHRVAYDIPTAQQKIRAAQLPSILADRLAIGR